jgi:hypothetical protein
MKIAVIGAGYGGLAAAYDLKKAGHAVTIFESANYVGGLASGFKEPHWDWSVEKFYHHWFQTDSEMLGLIRELGLEDRVRFPRPFTVMLYKNKWHPFDSIPRALLFPGLGFGLNKIRFGFVGLFLRLTNNWRALEKVTADAWMLKWAGKQVYEQMEAVIDRQVRAVLQGCQHGLDVGAHQGAHDAAGDIRGRIPKICGSIRREAAGFGSRDPAWSEYQVDQAGAGFGRFERGRRILRSGSGHHLPKPDGKVMSRPP